MTHREGCVQIQPLARGLSDDERGMYDSVAGQEAALQWTENPRLIEQGEEFGRQFVTFNGWQAYPEFVVRLHLAEG